MREHSSSYCTYIQLVLDCGITLYLSYENIAIGRNHLLGY